MVVVRVTISIPSSQKTLNTLYTVNRVVCNNPKVALIFVTVAQRFKRNL